MMKPHPSIFTAALGLVDVPPAEALMVGDSVRHDVEGALQVGMHAALLHRSSTAASARAGACRTRGFPILRSLHDLPALVRG